MSWKFEQSTGKLTGPKNQTVWGWAGQGEGRNNPTWQQVHGKGPLPVGKYTIGDPHDSPHTGPFTMNLTPSPSNTMFGRGDFRIHGAAKTNPELSSEGCVIMDRQVRESIWASGDRDLEVIA